MCIFSNPVKQVSNTTIVAIPLKKNKSYRIIYNNNVQTDKKTVMVLPVNSLLSDIKLVNLDNSFIKLPSTLNTNFGEWKNNKAYFDKERGYSRQKIIFNYGRINNDEDLLKCQQILKEYEKGNEFVKLNDLNIQTKSYGIYYTISQLFEKCNIGKVLKSNLQKGKHQFDVYSIIQSLIVNRLENPLSKNKAFEYRWDNLRFSR